MFQAVVSLFLICFSLSSAGGYGSRETGDPSEGQNKLSRDLSARIARAKQLLERENRLVSNWCSDELKNIYSTERNLLEEAQRGRVDSQLVTSKNKATADQLLLCSRKITGKIMTIKHPISQEPWYDQYLAGKKYLKDFERYPELEEQFNGKMDTAYQQFRQYSAETGAYEPTAIIFRYVRSHPHLKENHAHQKDTLPYRYNAMLEKLKEAKTCKPEETKQKQCFENLTGQLAEDSEDSLAGVWSIGKIKGLFC